MNIVCSHCGALNRVPPERLGDKPVCGKCKTLLLPASSVELTDSSFSRFVSKTDMPILVDFWAPWCGPCRMMAPAFEQASFNASPNAIFAKLNTEDNPSVASQFAITGIPTIILFRGGREVNRHSGMLDAAGLSRFALQ
ncbi:MAG: thioredoxin TrxC [Rhodopirellula sp. JB044]|uniref:thioredoxin TrxC n=1 Tax=Rhodopirellula sp. JB044 TaxID=3342844 RepID=UPI00370CAD5F